jgi:large subunit ribosomal protein L18|tara:strand:- start:253 stop:585 length:333 start_codon:yes stop_codon:yes gene_type:complete
MINQIEKNKLRIKRHFRNRKNIFGTAEIPRLYVFRSLKNYYVSIVDDTKGITLASAKIARKESSEKLAEILAEKVIKIGINKVIFDKSGYKYHGRLKQFADSLRERGISF